MTLPRYPAYRDSGVEWLGEVPAHWTTVRLGALFREATEEGCEGLPILSVSIHDGVSDRELADEEMDRKVSRSDDVTKYRRVEPGDLVYNMMRAWQGGFGTVTVSGMVSPAYVIARPTTGLATSFAEQLLRTSAAVEEMRRLSKGVTAFRLRLYWDEFKTLKIAVPSEPEQAAIAAFLDRETAKIDALVGQQERLIELLAEKRRAVVSLAVTKGLDRHAPMKDSGIDWLGEVPAHWEVKSFRRILHGIEQGWSPQTENRPADEDEFAIIKLSAISEGRFLPDENKAFEIGMDPDLRFEIEAGDVLLTRANTPDLVGECCVVGAGVRRGLMLPDLVYRLHLADDVSAEFVFQSLRSSIGRFQIGREARGSSMTMAKISQEHIKSWLVPCPPRDEQRAIATHLDAITSKFDALTTEARSAVALLKERRAALISAAVTGKIDVRGFVEEAA